MFRLLPLPPTLVYKFWFLTDKSQDLTQGFSLASFYFCLIYTKMGSLHQICCVSILLLDNTENNLK
uniref:Uncharacterized protein n=1 Tax=Anguilla anguilla TaxID=7936 RepID=A0A0E9U979_ANGAN